MKRNDQSIYENFSHSMWQGSQRFERLLAGQVRPRFEYFDKISPDWKDLVVLDLGCGGGFMSEELAKRGAKVLGVDPSESLIKEAKNHAQINNLDITYTKGTGESIPLPTSSVDRVVCVDVLEHVNDVNKVISEIRRVLRKGGIFFFDTINRNRFAKFMAITMVEDVLRIIPKGAHDPVKFITPDELKSYLKTNGFTIPDEFIGLKISRINKHLDFEIGLTPSTRVMYMGYAL